MKGECTEKRDRELCCVFFFSSRRRHTRCSRDWSSDVCSSDLVGAASGGIRHNRFNVGLLEGIHRLLGEVDGSSLFSRMHKQGPTASLRLWRSEERRVGKSVDLGGRRIIKKKKCVVREWSRPRC